MLMSMTILQIILFSLAILVFAQIKSYVLCVILIDAENEVKKKYNYINIIQEFCRNELVSLKTKPIQYIILESILFGVIILSVFLIFDVFQDYKTKLLAILFFYSLLVLTIVDYKTQYLPDIITKTLIVVGMIVNYYDVFVDFKSALIGSLAGYWSLWLINALFKKVRKKDGMGMGDFKLFSAFGAWLGYSYLPYIIFCSSIISIIIVVFLHFFKDKNLLSQTPFGPALSISAFIFILYGEKLASLYYQSFVY